MFLNILTLAGGLVLILVGANALTDGASAIAKRWGVSDLLIGLTVVAFGTSAPELTISIVSAVNHNAGLAVGNVVGSNIFNILVIIGVVAAVRPIKVTKSLLNNDIPLVLLSSLAILAIGCGPWLGDGAVAQVSRVSGLLLLLFFLVFLRYSFASAGEGSVPDNAGDAALAETGTAVKAIPLWKSLLMTVGGLAALIWGGDIFVKGASAVASALGVSDEIIGLTIVAAGTSLPELAASLAAALKGKTGIALGNVIGSCIFNAFLVLGVSAVIYPLPFGGIGTVDLLTLAGASALFWIFGTFFRDKTFTRAEGIVMAVCYVAYITYLVVTAVKG